MIKKTVSLVILICMMTVFCACFLKTNMDFAKVNIDGVEVNLSDDFETVVSALSNKDFYVASLYKNNIAIFPRWYFDEDGEVNKAEEDEIEDYIWGDNISVSQRYKLDAHGWEQQESKKGTLVLKSFFFYGETDYYSNDGIENDSNARDLKDLKGYEKCIAFFDIRNEVRGALYIDGKIIDLSKYEEKYDDWRDSFDDNGLIGSFEGEFSNIEYSYIVLQFLTGDRFRACNDFDELETLCEELNFPLKDIIVLAYAMQDAGRKLENGKIDSYALIRYEEHESRGMIMQYDEFYFDKDYDEDRYH